MKKILSALIAITVFLQIFVMPILSEEDVPVKNGVYKIITANNNKNCISIERMYRDDPPSTDNNAPAVADRYVGNGKYDFKIEKVGQKYRLISMNSGKALTVKGAEEKGAQLVQRNINDNEMQLFRIVKNENGYYSFVTDSGLYIDISGGSKEAGTPLILWSQNNSANQWFRIIPVEREEVKNPPDGLKSGLNIISYPAKVLYHVGESFDSSGFLAYQMDSKKKVVVYPIEEFEFFVDDVRLYDGRPFTAAGMKKVVIECGLLGIKFSYQINVTKLSEAEAEAKAAEALPSTASVLIDGQEVAFEAYNINGSNYFKLRDIAMAVKDSRKSFSIDWDASFNRIILKRQSPYTPVGGELAVNPAQTTMAKPSSSLLYVGSTKYDITAYNINGNNYIGLRDFMKIIYMKLDWDGERNVISIDTRQYYQTGPKTETTQNPRTTVVCGVRIGTCTVDSLKALYGEPTEILTESVYSDAKERYLSFDYYVYAEDYSQLLIFHVLEGYVVGVYSGTDVNMKSGNGINVKKYRDNIQNINYATQITNDTILSSFVSEEVSYSEGHQTQAKLMFYITNSLRGINGLSPLQHSSLADKSARLYAEEMAKADHFNHIGPDGSTPMSRMQKVGISAKGYGENIIAGYQNAYKSGEGWYNSPGHRANILNTGYTHVGNGFGGTETLYGVQNFYTK